MTHWFAIAARDARQAFAPDLPGSIVCEYPRCALLARRMSEEIRDGYRIEVFLCPEGHQQITSTRLTEQG